LCHYGQSNEYQYNYTFHNDGIKNTKIQKKPNCTITDALNISKLVVSVQLGGSRRGIDAAANWPLATDH
jgi:hypothetical protein